MICEICGKRRAIKTVKIEGAEVEICEVCLGKVDIDKGTKIVRKREKKPEKSIEIVDNIGEIVKSKRLEKGMGVKDFASFLRIQENLLRRIEHGFIPDLKTVRKLEKALGVKLTEEVLIEETPNYNRESQGLSLEMVSEIEEDGS